MGLFYKDHRATFVRMVAPLGLEERYDLAFFTLKLVLLSFVLFGLWTAIILVRG